ncbi:MAG: hypothetical protein WA118_05310 [Carboxydocellales bacterium]
MSPIMGQVDDRSDTCPDGDALSSVTSSFRQAGLIKSTDLDDDASVGVQRRTDVGCPWVYGILA